MSHSEKVRLGEVARLQAGVGFPVDLQGRSTGPYPLAKVGDISRGGRSGEAVLSSTDHYVDETDLERLRTKPVPQGSILFAKIGEAIRQNHRVIAGCEMLIDNNAMAAIPGPTIASQYLYHYLRTVDFYRLASATTVPALRKSELEKITIPLPALVEQRRIAEVLDRAEALRAKRRASLAQLDALTNAIFLDLFGDPNTNSRRWLRQSLGEVTEKITDGEHLNPQFSQSGMPIVMAGNVLDDHVDVEHCKKVDQSLGERFRRKCDPRVGDLLIVSRGATIGRACIVDIRESFCLMGSVILVRPRKLVMESQFLGSLLKHPVMQTILYKTSGSSAQQAMYLKDLKRLSCVVPPITLQREFARCVEAIEKLKKAHRASLAEVDVLFAALQHRAFRGKL